MNKQNSKPWLNRKKYPFQSNYFDLPIGKMHYLDEGEGDPIVFVHGNPGWSYEFRESIKELSKTNRCIAVDHIGFGLSEKPYDWDYLPESHATNLSNLLSYLNLDNIVLVVNDWGGPIGLSYALNNFKKIKHLMITNTWMWSVSDNPSSKKFSAFAGGIFGRFLIKYFNFFGKVIIKYCFGDKKYFDKTIYKHLETPKDRKGCWVFPKQIIASSDWLDSLWQKRKSIEDIPATVIWGAKDVAFEESQLHIWKNILNNKTIIKLDTVGHYPYEEAADLFIRELKKVSI